jgi:hypothetical protein
VGEQEASSLQCPSSQAPPPAHASFLPSFIHSEKKHCGREWGENSRIFANLSLVKSIISWKKDINKVNHTKEYKFTPNVMATKMRPMVP